MVDLLLGPDRIVFAAALLLMVLIGAVEALGLGSSAIDVDIGLDHDGALGWLGIGDVPLLITVVTFLGVFGVVGLGGQDLVEALRGHALAPLAAVPLAFVIALPLARFAVRGLARILPRDESSAVPVDDLVGRTGTITVGRATQGSPARARVADRHGQVHHVAVEPDHSDTALYEGDTVLLVRREGATFRAIRHDPPPFSEWIRR